MQRLTGLKRLGAVYGLIEEIHSIEARVAAAKAGIAERAAQAETHTLRDAWMEERRAMQGEDSLGRLAMAAREDVARRKRRALEPVIEKRTEIHTAARERHMASRLWSERMQSLVDAEAARIAAEKERRSQAVADDRFLAQRWNKKRKTETQEMRLS
jgi:hypothetical protein